MADINRRLVYIDGTTIVLFVHAKSDPPRFSITNQDGDLAWYGRLFANEADEMSTAELTSGKKAVWLAKQVAEKNTLKNINLKLFVGAKWLCYANDFLYNPKMGGKATALSKLALKNGVNLEVIHVGGSKNPADKYISKIGYFGWKEGLGSIKLFHGETAKKEIMRYKILFS